MRTTLTLDADVAKLLREEVHRQRRPLKQVVNDALRRALAPRGPSSRPAHYRVEVHESSLQPGLDRGKLNALADEHEDRELTRRKHRKRAQ